MPTDTSRDKDENDFVDTEYGDCNIKKALEDRDKAMKEEQNEN